MLILESIEGSVKAEPGMLRAHGVGGVNTFTKSGALYKSGTRSGGLTTWSMGIAIRWSLA